MKKYRIYISIKYRFTLIKKLFRKSYNFLVPFENYGIINQFGRLGNNLQQIALATLYVNKFSKNFYLTPLKMVITLGRRMILLEEGCQIHTLQPTMTLREDAYQGNLLRHIIEL